MRSLTLGKRVALGFAAVIAVTFVLGIVAYNRFLAASDAGEYLATDPVPGTIAIIDIAGAFKENFALVEMYLNTKAKEKTFASIQKNKVHIDELIKAYEATITTEEDRGMFGAFKEYRTAFVTEFSAVIALSDKGAMAEALDAAETRMVPAYARLSAQLGKLVDFNQKNLNSGVARVTGSSQEGKRAILIGVFAAVLAAAAIAFFIVRGTSRILASVAEVLDSGSSQIASAAGQVSASSQSLAEGASEQAASLEETSASLEEMSSMTKRSAENAQHAKSAAGEARTSADAGGRQMQSMQHAMDAIQAASTDISKILKTIDEIAFQTNILALNAAVEAARAGEAGAGFAVVADEVRALAQRCASAAKETAGKIEDATTKSHQGAQISREVATSFEAIQQQIHRLDSIVGEIATASHEQSQGIGQVTTAVSQMDKVTQSNAGSAEESAAAAEELNAQSAVMRESVGQLLALIGGTVKSVATHVPEMRAPRTSGVPNPPRKRVVAPQLAARAV